MSGSNAENKTVVDNILRKLRPIIERMTADAPDWGTINLNITLNAGVVKQLEIASSKSMV